MERYLTDEDIENLDSYQQKCDEVRNFTISCIRGTHTGLLLFGAGGNGKSYSVRETLANRKIAEVQPETINPFEDEDEPESVPGSDPLPQ